jgi:hypothetical protein
MPIALKFWQLTRGISVNRQDNPRALHLEADPQEEQTIKASSDQSLSSSLIGDAEATTQ